jgi:hypothetical protein
LNKARLAGVELPQRSLSARTTLLLKGCIRMVDQKRNRFRMRDDDRMHPPNHPRDQHLEALNGNRRG